MRYYPIGLDISGRRCVVVGGGEVGERKTERLLECGARVAIVATELTPGLRRLARAKRIEHIPRPYERSHLRDAFLVIGATDDRLVNEKIVGDARRKGVIANIVDAPDLCDFVLPAVCRRGDLVITVATGGKSPALSRRLRREIEERYGPEYETFIRILEAVRPKVLARGEGPEANRKTFTALVESDLLAAVRAKDWKGVRERVKKMTGVSLPAKSFRAPPTPGKKAGAA